MKVRKVVQRRVRADGQGSIVADVNAAVAANVGEGGRGGASATATSSRQHIVQRSRRRGSATRKGKT